MTTQTATRIVLASRPTGEATLDNFRLEQTPVPVPGEGQVLLRTHYLSLDPYMRGRMDDRASYVKPVEVGEVMGGECVAEVVSSNHPRFSTGDRVVARVGWQTHAVLSGDAISRKLEDDAIPESLALGVYGMPGFTAYGGLREIGKPKAGETLVVAAASGPVGATVGQIARIAGARAVGIAGGEDKRRYLETIGFDVALDYRATDFVERLRAAVPAGIDVYFESVGGAVFDAVLPLLNDFARIPVCGTIATYATGGASAGTGTDRLPPFMSQVLRKHLTIRGFIYSDFGHLHDDFLSEMGAWLKEGRMRYLEDVREGLESAPEAFLGMLKGRNFGKLLVRVR